MDKATIVSPDPEVARKATAEIEAIDTKVRASLGCAEFCIWRTGPEPRKYLVKSKSVIEMVVAAAAAAEVGPETVVYVSAVGPDDKPSNIILALGPPTIVAALWCQGAGASEDLTKAVTVSAVLGAVTMLTPQNVSPGKPEVEH